ncbi:MAG: methyl-accepting chemotaxis protein [Paracoccus sp. (in: a-proteobacteria)]|nr:methyl-accepting chemotaxis protein [Paracoccus sp. (in: a-proteobacteria)]
MTSHHPNPELALKALDQAQISLRMDSAGTILAANRNYLDLTGQTADIVGQNFTRLLHDHADHGAAALIMQDLRAGRARTEHLRHKHRDGEPVWFVTCFAPVADENGEIAEIRATLIDVTDRHQAARETERKFQALSNSQAIIEFTVDGEIRSANQNFLDAMGYTIDEIKGRRHMMFVTPEYARSPDYADMWSDLRSGGFRSGEFERVGKGGRPVHIVASYNPIKDSSGKVLGVIKIASDVTRMRLAVNELIAGLDSMSRGNLSVRISDEVSGDFASVRKAFNTSLSQIAEMITAARQQSQSMQGEANEISGAARDLAQRGESQAAALEQTAASVEQISGNIDMTSEAARDADSSARSARDTVLHGAEIVEKAIGAMTRIEEHTKNMADFTRVIENFAFQTNLLSINAAVEAARAGEVGRGFAVVAGEVRNLAQQSANASQNIAELIAKSEEEVKSGVRLVSDAGEALKKIQSVVGGMAENISGIAHATSQQSIGVREVSEALAQLDQVNQANLTMSDSYAAAAASLSGQLTELTEMMARFQTGADGAASGAAPTRAVA